MLLTNLTVVLAMMLLLWAVSIAQRDASIIDPFWGLGFIVVAWVSCYLCWPVSPRAMLIAGLVTVWGLRLSSHLFWRNHRKPEDARYTAMREKHGDRFWWVSLFTVFWLQAILLWFIAFPIQFVASDLGETPLGWLDAVGFLLWLSGFFFESVGDWQLARFRADPANKGKVLDSGLWRYTRHPNYFGDFCVWWGIYVLSIGGGGAWTFLSPLLMSVFLIKISGAALLEKDIGDRRPEYSAYKMRTSNFFPAPPKRP
jgi:steroid 5-alpha reductase family enzyme